MAANSVWNPDNIRDVAESIGLSSLPVDVVQHLTRDVEFRIAQVLDEALKFMRHAKRTTLFTSDVTNALRVLEVEPLYGYDSTRPLRFGEAPIGPGQPLYYLEDEEVDFEKLINAPLPKVPRDMTFTAHWLAVEGVQPTIPQNPTPADAAGRQSDLLPKPGSGTAQHLAATSGADNVSVKPLVKHILSKELQLYFEHICSAVLDETNDAYRGAALKSLRADPGLHQLVPYFVKFVAEKITHNLKNLFVLTQMMHLVDALLHNPNMYIAMYVPSLVPPVLTCLVAKRLGPSASSPEFLETPELNGNGNGTNGNIHPDPLPAHYALRDLAASLLAVLTQPSFTSSAPTTKPRLAKALFKSLLSTSSQPLGVYYGAILGLTNIVGAEGFRTLVLRTLPTLDTVLKEALEEADSAQEETAAYKRREVEAVVGVVLRGLVLMEEDGGALLANLGRSADSMDVEVSEDEKQQLLDKLGSVVGDRVIQSGRRALISTVLAADSE